MVKKIMCLLISVFVMCLTSCYDHEEIDTLATVMAVGVENNYTDNSLNKYTFAFADTGGISSDSGGEGVSLITYTQTAKDIKTAADIISQKTSKKISFSHLSVILFSIDSARGGMYEDIKYFENNSLVRPQTLTALTTVSPSEYLKNLRLELQVNPEKYFQGILQKNKTYVSTMRLCDFLNAYYCNEQILAPVIGGKVGQDSTAKDKVFVKGSGIIYNGRLLRYFEDDSLLGLILSKKEVTHNNLRLKSVRKPKISMNTNSNVPVVNITLYIWPDGSTALENTAKEIQDFVRACAKEGLDVINIKRESKKYFLLQKSYDRTNWDEFIKRFEFKVSVVAKDGDV